MKDCKHIHEDLLDREDLDYRKGWKRGQTWVSGLLWGVIVVELILIGMFK